MAEPGVQDLLGVGGADRGDLVGGLDGALHEVGAAVVLHHMGVPRADAAGILQDIQAVLALVGDVVDGEHRLDAVELVQVAVVQVQVDGRQRGLPVVAVDDVGLEIGIEQHFEDGAGEEGEALAVIVEAVQAAALEVVFVVDEIEGNALVLGLEQAAVLAAPAHRHAEVGHIGQGVFVFQVAVQRHDHTAVHTVLDQRFGQRPGHIGQTAGLCKRSSLAGCIQNSHK